MATLGNIIWVICGGLIETLAWCVAGIVMCITIIGIPAGFQCFKIATFTMWPFGRKVIYDRRDNKVGNILLNILWFLLCGWELALVNAIAGMALCFTFIGIPFGLQYFKLAGLSLRPFGAKIVPKDFEENPQMMYVQVSQAPSAFAGDNAFTPGFPVSPAPFNGYEPAGPAPAPFNGYAPDPYAAGWNNGPYGPGPGGYGNYGNPGNPDPYGYGAPGGYGHPGYNSNPMDYGNQGYNPYGSYGSGSDPYGSSFGYDSGTGGYGSNDYGSGYGNLNNYGSGYGNGYDVPVDYGNSYGSGWNDGYGSPSNGYDDPYKGSF